MGSGPTGRVTLTIDTVSEKLAEVETRTRPSESWVKGTATIQAATAQ